MRRHRELPTTRRRRRLDSAMAALAIGLAVSAALIGCGATEGPVATFPAASIGPDRTVSPAVGQTRGAIESALRDRGLTLVDAQVPYRPAEGPRLTAAPRAVYQAVLPDDPSSGFIVVYELPDTDLADQAAREQAAYLATGPGRVQSSLNAVDVIRVVGSTVILYSWIPEDAQDALAPGIQAALETIGTGVPVPS